MCTLLLLHLCVNDEASEHPLVNKHYKQYHYGCDTPLPLLIYTPCRFTSNLDEILSTSIPGMTFTLTVSKLRASNQGYYCGHQSCQRKCLEELNTRVIYLIASDISDKCVPHWYPKHLRSPVMWFSVLGSQAKRCAKLGCTVFLNVKARTEL